MPEEPIKSAVYQMSLETLEVEEIVGGDKKEPDGSETVVACCTVSSVPGGFVIWYRTDEGVEKAKLIFLDHNGETRKIREMRIRDRRLDAVVGIGLKNWYEQAPLFIADDGDQTLYLWNPGIRRSSAALTRLAQTGDDLFGDGQLEYRFFRTGATTAQGQLVFSFFGPSADLIFAMAVIPVVSSVQPTVVADDRLVTITGSYLSLPDIETTLLIGGERIEPLRTVSLAVSQVAGGTPDAVSFEVPMSLAAGSYPLELEFSDGEELLMVSAGEITVEAVLPRPNPISVLHGASFQETIAPCGIASLFGANLTMQSAESASDLPLPTKLASTSVTLDGVAAPLFFVSSGQVNFQVPCEITGVQSLQVKTPADEAELDSELLELGVSEVAPGLFTWPDGETAIAQDFGSDGKSFFVLDPSKPEAFAAPGDFLVFYLSGLGQTIPATLTNTPAEVPLPDLIQSPTITVGGSELSVLYGGSTPGFIGLYQINVQLSEDITVGNAVPVEVTSGEQSSQIAMIPIRRIDQ